MAAAPTLPLVTADEYLNSSYEHDMEYVDGVLVERGMPTIPHSLLQKLLLLHFAQHENAQRFVALQEIRIQILEKARYRIPDVMIFPKPLPKGRIFNRTPSAVIEILSPDDTLAATRDRFRDYARIGVHQLVLMDPEEYIAYRFENGSLIQTSFQELGLESGASVPFPSEDLFAQLKQKLYEE